jgi:hypothetical protein
LYKGQSLVTCKDNHIFCRVKFSREIVTLKCPFWFWKRKNAVKELFAVKRKIKPLAGTTPSAKNSLVYVG